MIWKNKISLKLLNSFCGENMNGHLGIEFVEIGADYLIARMPVDHRTMQPEGILHGGASVVLAETMGGIAAVCCLEEKANKTSVGVEINANHLRPGTPPHVYGKTFPVKIGRSIQVWNIEITDGAGELVCVSRITLAIVERRE